MEQGLYPFLLHWLQILWWPFARIMALLAFAPIFGDPTVPVRVRVTIALTLAVVALPSVSSAVISVNAFSLTAVALTLEQIAIGAVLGLALQFATTALSIFGFLSASQTSLAMAMLNDPVNGSSSDALSVLALLLGMLLFFVLDIHLLVAGIVSASFDAWPVGQSLNRLQLQTVAYNMGWVFAAAFLLATPIIFAAMLVQLGFGFMARISPSLNIFALGFSVVTLFGLAMLAFMLRHIPAHYLQMTRRALDMLTLMMKA
ncbi:flagellar biosynthetic protein FliR [Comamonas terrigena]|uniref:flagellar biosynthetic protein FliR n=1 Tax=Comamonas terrigena TaxID=32013 RepID=UPI002449B5E3|nr:flagellar biosynthetic protein FliR [Comamonas terrigena]MDH0049156.1 flagellar biosynthetic protein FliR [Comamonas terrigena]MDH0512055.1 flagellar biosynthetic protein FliR [Comamonas terrigena]MDH1091567.1 flagellar biosynthetic protein FliR [Comamonas terrigena]MDH1500452.1 flagellar biosynthetic protein FliR [Comamonas terrigena]